MSDLKRRLGKLERAAAARQVRKLHQAPRAYWERGMRALCEALEILPDDPLREALTGFQIQNRGSHKP